MKKLLVILLALLVLAVNVGAEAPCVIDESALVPAHQIQFLEDACQDVKLRLDYTPMVVTVDSFGGLTAEEYAKSCYDVFCYDENAMLLLVSISEGEWYILTNGACYHRISNADTQNMGGILVEYLRDGEYYEGFAMFPELAEEAFCDSTPGEESAPAKKNYGKTIAISMVVGFAIAGIAVGIMAYQMKSVRKQTDASDYVRSGSMQIRDRRDIFLYSHVSRSPKPKSNSSGSSGGGSRGGSGGKI